MRVAIESFRGEAPRVAPEHLPENAAQSAVNARLQSGNLETWRQFALTHSLVHSADVQTIYLLNDVWLSWESDVDVARGAIPGDNTFRVYLTGPDEYNEPRFTNYAMATAGSEPYPVTTRPLGVPAPDSQPTLEAGVSTAPSSTTVEVTDDGDQLDESWSTSPPVNTAFTRSHVTEPAGSGNGPPSYLLTYAENVNQPAYAYRDFGVGDSQVVFFSVDVMFGPATRRRMFIDALASATGAGIGIVWTEAGSFQIGIMSGFSAQGFSALDGVSPGAPGDGIWYTVTGTTVRNAAGTKTVTATLYQGSAQLAVVTTTNAFVNDGGNFGFVAEISEPTSPDPQIYYDNILVRGTSPTAALQQTATSYVYTFVNDLGEESAPSPPSATILKDDGTAITVTSATSVQSGFSVDYGVTHKRIYRAASGATGTVFRFVAETPLAQAEYVDELTDAELGDPLETELYALPPDDLRGILALPNGIMVGFRRNQICFSVQNRPHAWPVEWRLNTDTDVVGIGNIDTTLVIGTEAFPYLAIGNDPAAYSMTKLEKKQACVSKRSVAHLTGIGVAFASPDGTVAVNGNGSVRNLTETIFTRRQWQALAPETLLGVEHDDVYHFWFSEETFTEPVFVGRVSAADTLWRAIVWGNDTWVAVGNAGTNGVMTSPDAVTWTARNAAASADWFGVAYKLGRFVAVSGSTVANMAMYSDNDGVTWSLAATPPSNISLWSSVAYSPELSLFAAVAFGGGGTWVSTSPDGSVWTDGTAVAGPWFGITWGNGLFVAVGGAGASSGLIMTSPDGLTWTSRTPPVDGVNVVWGAVAYGNGMYVAVAQQGTIRIASSPDGITWTSRSAPAVADWRAIAYNGHVFATLGSSSQINISSDGITWSLADSTIPNLLWKGIASDGEGFAGVAATGSGNRAMSGDVAVSNVGVGGYALDMKETGFGLITLSYHACAVHSDPLTDNLYLVLTGDEEPTGPSGTLLGSTAPLLTDPFVTIYQFDADEDVTPKGRLWRGKLNLLPRPAAFNFCQVKARDYDNLALNLYAEGVLFFSAMVTSKEPFTLPLTDDYEEFEFEFVGTSRVNSAQFVEDIRELT